MVNLQNVIDIIRGAKIIIYDEHKKHYSIVNNFYYIYKKYNKQNEKRLKNKLKNGEKIKVCFSIIYDSVFPAENIFKKMLDDKMFDPFILVIPDILRGEENMFYQMDKTYKSFVELYGKDYIKISYSYNKKEFEDYAKDMDICFFANPYDIITHSFYTVKYLLKKTLCMHIPYSYTGHLNYNTNIYGSDEYSMFSKIFVENENTFKIIQEHKKYNTNNLKVVGYPKMDNIVNFEYIDKQSKRPLIIITPHHTVRRVAGQLNISKFLRFADYYLEMPNKYPNIDFIFRPHPLLFVILSNDDLWGKEKTNSYIQKIKSIPNMKYQEGGEYFATFAKSDALINDCGSFLPEYFYFGKPQCYLLENKKEINQEFTNFGKKILNYVYKAYNDKDIEKFIDDIILKHNDYMKEERQNFAKNEIMFNYPDVTNSIVKYLKEELNAK